MEVQTVANADVFMESKGIFDEDAYDDVRVGSSFCLRAKK